MKLLIRTLAIVGFLVVSTSIPAHAVSADLVISQLYIGAGAADLKLRNQYIELFNRGTATVPLQGWTLQYVAEGVNTWTTFLLSGNLAPGQYYLIRLSAIDGNATLPQADLTISLLLPLTVGKIAVVHDTVALDTGCPSVSTVTTIVDLLGYGNTNCFETSPLALPVPTDPLAQLRKGGGCTDTDNNATDFSSLTPLPRNSASALNFCAGTSGSRTFSIADKGGISFRSTGTASASTVGYTRVRPDSSSSAPAGVAIFGLRQGGTLVSETGVGVAPLLTNGLTYVDISGFANTGIAVANPNNQDVQFDYVVNDSNSVLNFSTGSIKIMANTQVARFLTEWPFVIRGQTGTLTFIASAPVAVTTLRGYTNERGEFLVSTFPVIDLSVPASTSATYLPHFAVGGGWRTELVLINAVGTSIGGTIAFFDPSGNPVSVPIGTITASTVDYAVPSNRTLRFVLPNRDATVQIGSVRITPTQGDRAPVALGLFSFTFGGVRVSEAAVSGLRGTTLRTYFENSGTIGSLGSIQSGVAIANADSIATSVTLEAFRLDGTSTGLTKTLTIPVGGQFSQFATEMFPTLPTTFQGVMRLTSSAAISIIGLRGRYNERNDFLITTVPASEELLSGSSAEVVFPHMVDGGGYTTQFVLFNKVNSQTSTGTLLFRTTGAQLLDLNFQ